MAVGFVFQYTPLLEPRPSSFFYPLVYASCLRVKKICMLCYESEELCTALQVTILQLFAFAILLVHKST